MNTTVQDKAFLLGFLLKTAEFEKVAGSTSESIQKLWKKYVELLKNVKGKTLKDNFNIATHSNVSPGGLPSATRDAILKDLKRANRNALLTRLATGGVGAGLLGGAGYGAYEGLREPTLMEQLQDKLGY